MQRQYKDNVNMKAHLEATRSDAFGLAANCGLTVRRFKHINGINNNMYSDVI